MGWTVVKLVRGSDGRVDRGVDCSQTGWGGRVDRGVDCSQMLDGRGGRVGSGVDCK